jgi:toluene monooxygenase system ferredoxin subunit
MWRKVCQVEEVPQSGMKEFAVEGASKILIVNTGSEYFAYQALCPHEAVPLEQGIHDGSVLTCLEHLWQFDVRTGAPLGDADTGLASHRLKQEDGALHVWVEDGKAG